MRRAGAHMALERQALPESLVGEEIEDLTRDFVREPKPQLWDD